MDIYTRHSGWNKSEYAHISNGSLKVVGTENNRDRDIEVKNGEIAKVVYYTDKKRTRELVYGGYDRTYANGKKILEINFLKGSNTTREGNAFITGQLFDYVGKRHQKYRRGSLLAEKFIYKNRRVAYDITRYSAKPVEIKYQDGRLAMRIVSNDKKPCIKFAYTHTAVPENPIEYLMNNQTWRWSAGIATENYSVEAYGHSGVVQFMGKVEKRQRVGKWIVPDGSGISGSKDAWYLQGVQVSEHIFSTPPEQLKVMEVMEIENAQLRSALLSKYSSQGLFDKLVSEGIKVTEQVEGDMRLLSIPIPKAVIANQTRNAQLDIVMKFLEVTCPSTKAKYMLKVPPQTTSCEEGRQWTFGKDFTGRDGVNGIPKDEYITFTKET